MITVYIGDPDAPKTEWEVLDNFEEMNQANLYAQNYLKQNVPNLMFVRQRNLPNMEYWTHLVDYGFEKGLLIEDRNKKEGATS